MVDPDTTDRVSAATQNMTRVRRLSESRIMVPKSDLTLGGNSTCEKKCKPLDLSARAANEGGEPANLYPRVARSAEIAMMHLPVNHHTVVL